MADDVKPTIWDTRYDRDDYLFGTAPSAFVARHASRLKPGSTVLSVAEGEGRNAVHLAQLGMKITAFDSSARGLEKARSLAVMSKVDVAFYHAGVDDWDWAATQYDAISAVFIQFAGPQMRARIFAGLDIALRPGGLLLLHGFAPRQIGYATGGPPFAENMYDLPMLNAEFPNYSVLHQADYDEVVDAGPGHSGLAAMVDFVAEKPVA